MSTRIWYLFSFNEVSMPSYRAAKVPNIKIAQRWQALSKQKLEIIREG